MAERYKFNPGDFAEYLQSVGKLDALEKMTQELDRELEDSQRIMREIRCVFDSVSVVPENPPQPANDCLRHENISNFLDAGVPKLLMPDMVEDTMDVDINDVIATMKSYAEDLKKNLTLPGPLVPKPKEVANFDLDQYAQSLDQLSKRLANIKLNKKVDLNNRSAELESKLSQLCDYVNMFAKLVETKTALSRSNRDWFETDVQQDNVALQYDDVINKLLTGINEVAFLLQNKN